MPVWFFFLETAHHQAEVDDVYGCCQQNTMKINEKHLISFVSGSAAIDKQGFLNKRGELNKAFQRRWFVLKGNLLFYFERRTDAEPIGVIVIDGCSVELTENSDKYAFELAFSGSGTRTYVLAADSQVGVAPLLFMSTVHFTRVVSHLINHLL